LHLFSLFLAMNESTFISSSTCFDQDLLRPIIYFSGRLSVFGRVIETRLAPRYQLREIRGPNLCNNCNCTIMFEGNEKLFVLLV